MIERTLYNIAFSEKWGRQMRFITGPRQSGKTTLSKLKLERESGPELYYLWDLRSVRERYKKNELFFTADRPPKSGEKPWVCFDEIHKMPKWKNIMKGIFDSTEADYQFIVTGSAKLDISRRAGDSLSGRYFTFHLYPLCLLELSGNKELYQKPPESTQTFIKERMEKNNEAQKSLSAMLEYGGFPEPYLRQSSAFGKKWSEDYLDTVIKEDIGALTKIIERDYLYDLYKLLPEMAGSPISEHSIASHLTVTPPTVKNYLKKLDDFYLTFRIFPYSRNIKRSLLKAAKCYLYNWTRIKDPAKCFENYVAVELYSRLRLWEDAGAGSYDLFYIRTRQKKETDFLITKEQRPWLLLETKYSDGPIEKHHYDNGLALGVPVVQLCREENIALLEHKNAFRISASRFLAK